MEEEHLFQCVCETDVYERKERKYDPVQSQKQGGRGVCVVARAMKPFKSGPLCPLISPAAPQQISGTTVTMAIHHFSIRIQHCIQLFLCASAALRWRCMRVRLCPLSLQSGGMPSLLT